MEPAFLKLIKNDNTFLEREPLEQAGKKVNFMLLSTKVFGNVWILKETKIFWKKF